MCWMSASGSSCYAELSSRWHRMEIQVDSPASGRQRVRRAIDLDAVLAGKGASLVCTESLQCKRSYARACDPKISPLT